MFCQGISTPHTSQPFSQINNGLPRDYRLPRANTMSKRVQKGGICSGSCARGGTAGRCSLDFSVNVLSLGGYLNLM
eukprot:160768-Pelagomonas_calceolata.AAC.1